MSRRSKEGFWSRRARTRPMDLGRPEDSILVSGTGRSGTTWIADLLNHDGAYRLMFEPLHPQNVPDSAHFGWCRYLRPEQSAGAFERTLEAILAGRLRSPWSDGPNTRAVASRRLIKETRANLLLAWIARHHPELPLVLVVRHPFAVALSTTRLGWPVSLRTFLDQPDLMEDHLADLEPVLVELEARDAPGSREALFERAVADWCVQLLVPLRDLSPGQAHVVFYETLLARPEQELESVCRHVGRHFDLGVLERWSQPSRTATPMSAIRTGRDPLRAWRRSVPGPLVDRATAILEAFSLDGIYDDFVPRAAGDALLERFQRPRPAAATGRVA